MCQYDQTHEVRQCVDPLPELSDFPPQETE